MSSSKKKQPKRKRNGEGSIYQLKSNGKWVAQLMTNGKRKTIATGKKYDEVKAKLDKAIVEIREKTYIERDGKTIGTILEGNLKQKERKNKVCESTILRDRNTANVILKSNLANLPIQKATREDIQDFLDDVAENYSNSYIDKIYTHLSNVYKIAAFDHLIHENLFAMGAIEKPKSIKPDKAVIALSRTEQEKLVSKLKDPNYHDDYKDVFFFLIETGMRVRRSFSIRKTETLIQ